MPAPPTGSWKHQQQRLPSSRPFGHKRIYRPAAPPSVQCVQALSLPLNVACLTYDTLALHYCFGRPIHSFGISHKALISNSVSRTVTPEFNDKTATSTIIQTVDQVLVSLSSHHRRRASSPTRLNPMLAYPNKRRRLVQGIRPKVAHIKIEETKE